MSYNMWFLNKILKHLKGQEKCTIETVYYTADGAKTVLKDIDGQVYEVVVRAIQKEPNDLPKALVC